MTSKVPAIVLNRLSERAKETLDKVAKFVEEDCIP
ncbi:hypothetical protein BN1723_015136 [Verticillium longisporum]|nr:hypothetical protein VDGD_20315 [Verticillium dahliae]CRK36884.1 hypothetical protein BN1723_015136 [Verticillium longisporum]